LPVTGFLKQQLLNSAVLLFFPLRELTTISHQSEILLEANSADKLICAARRSNTNNRWKL
jgi:hypothetical protein